MIINSLLDNDLYVFSVSYAFFKNYPEASGVLEFKDRNNTKYTPEFVERLWTEISSLGFLGVGMDEEKYLYENIKYIPRSYFEWFSHAFKFDPGNINIHLDSEGHLSITVEEKLYKLGFYEIPILAIVSELTSKFNDYRVDEKLILKRLDTKIKLSNDNGLVFSEFGTRRRHSYDVQDMIMKRIKETSGFCSGTSNVHFAMKYDMKPIGTMNHFYIEFFGAQYGYNLANQMAMEVWSKTYRGDLGVFLTDTYTTEVFFNNLDKYHALLFTGVRQDSGDEFEFTKKMIQRYEELGVDPKTKTIFFSNGLDFPKFHLIKRFCEGKINLAVAGIGTNITHDTGYPHPVIVMKLIRCKMNDKQKSRECIKLSDDPGKYQGDPREIERCLDYIESYVD